MTTRKRDWRWMCCECLTEGPGQEPEARLDFFRVETDTMRMPPPVLLVKDYSAGLAFETELLFDPVDCLLEFRNPDPFPSWQTHSVTSLRRDRRCRGSTVRPIRRTKKPESFF